MQNYYLIFFMQNITKLFLTFKLNFIFFLAFSQSNEDKIQKADSLFNNQKFTEALKIYEESFNKSKLASPNMLLKMAFIHEGLNDYTKTLYYLSLYYLYAPNTETMIQMENIAHQYQLKGYEYSDLDLLKVIYYRYFEYLTYGLAIFCCFIYLYILYRNLIRRSVYNRYKFTFIISLLFLVLFILLIEEKPKAIIAKDNTYLMYSPSAGSELVKTIQKGHKVKILEKKDIWYKIEWGTQIAFVRESQLLLL